MTEKEAVKNVICEAAGILSTPWDADDDSVAFWGRLVGAMTETFQKRPDCDPGAAERGVPVESISARLARVYRGDHDRTAVFDGIVRHFQALGWPAGSVEVFYVEAGTGRVEVHLGDDCLHRITFNYADYVEGRYTLPDIKYDPPIDVRLDREADEWVFTREGKEARLPGLALRHCPPAARDQIAARLAYGEPKK